jgi:hypothetical protein
MTARVARAPRAGLADAAPRCSSQPGSDAIAGRGPADRAADLSGPARPVPVAGWCGRPANMSLVMARATPRPRDTQPHPRALTRLVVRAPGRRPAAAPGLRSGMFLPAEVTRGAVITGEFRARRRDRRPAAHGRLRRGGRAGRRHGAGVLVTAMPRFRCGRRHHRGDAAEPGGNPSSTGHVWITIWRRSGRDRFRIFSPTSLPTASVLVTGGGAVRVCPGHVRWHDPAYMHSSSTRLVHSPLHS